MAWFAKCAAAAALAAMPAADWGRPAGDGAAACRWAELNAAAREHARKPVRAGIPGVRPFWNAHARAFIHPPAFDFGGGEGECRFSLGTNAWTAAHSWSPVPGDVWDALPPGRHTLKAEGLGERTFHRAAVFRGPYPAPAEGRGAETYAAAARRVYGAVRAMRCVQGWKTSDGPPEGYDLYCYPSKIISSMIHALCKCKEPDALHIACRMADWLIGRSQPAGAPLAHFPPTYWGDRRKTAVKYAGENMLHYPAHAANAYFALADALPRAGAAKYRGAALAIARTYVRLQGSDGTWPLKVREADGAPVRANRLLPSRHEFDMFRRAHALSGDGSFAAASERAFAYIERGPLKTWNWDAQFEDMDPMPPYVNLQKGAAVDAALALFRMGRDREALEIVDWCEDQFVVWSDPVRSMDWRNWRLPCALEQYDYYTPIDASLADMVGAFLAAHKATGGALALAKAQALADCLVRNQRPDGTIPTYFDSRKGSDWVNCMVYAADRLAELAAVLAAGE